METKSDVTINVSNELIMPIIKEKIKLAMVEALNHEDQLINKVVETVLYDKVDENGKKSGYSSDNKYSYIDVVLRNAIKDEAKIVFKEFIDQYRTKIGLELQKQLQTRKGVVMFTSKILEAVTGNLERDWKLNVHFDFKEHDPQRY